MRETLIIGGGALGLSVAYHLGKRGARSVTLVERNTLTSGTSWHAAGIVGPLRATPNMTKLAEKALEVFPELERETGMSTGYRRTGGYWLARSQDRLSELHRIADLGVTLGLSSKMVTPDQLGEPMIDTSGLTGALHVPEDAHVNPVDLCMAYARAAKSYGVSIQEGVEIKRLNVTKGRITGAVTQDGQTLHADYVVLCAGAWSRHLAQTAGVALPLQPVEHMYVVTQAMPDLPDPVPVIRDLDRGIYIKGDAGRLVIGGFEPNAKCWDPTGAEADRPFLELSDDWEQFAPFLDAALDLIPALANTGIQRFMNGPESFTHDTRPLVGQCPSVDNLFVAAGMNSVGIMSSAGIGAALADWVVEGTPPIDLWEVDVARADPAAAQSDHLHARMTEAVADLFAMHWPYKQPQAGRGLRISPLHDVWAQEGAHFGVTGGWERALWFAQNKDEANLPYATGTQPWWPIARREVQAMETGAALIELTPFTKIDISGPDCASALNFLTTAQMDIAEGRAVYTQILNANGGIEMDVTVTCLARDRFHLTSGAATRQRDLAYLRRNLPGCVIQDKTEDFCTIGVMGAGAAEVLGAVFPGVEWRNVPARHVQDLAQSTGTLRATQMSFVGEFGWELMVPNAGARSVLNALLATGARPMGHYALDGCRIEKGFRHWGHDIGATVTPLEAGLGFTVDWSKPFLGKDALVAQRDAGVQRRVVLLQIQGDALMLHDEPIYEGSECIGFTTSGAMGPRTGANLAFGMIKVQPNETWHDLSQRDLRVRVAGQDFPARAIKRAAYDPDGRRMAP